MNAKEFCFWLQGAVEICGVEQFDKGQLDLVVEKLAEVFKSDPELPPAMIALLDQLPPSLPAAAAPITAQPAPYCAGKIPAKEYPGKLNMTDRTIIVGAEPRDIPHKTANNIPEDVRSAYDRITRSGVAAGYSLVGGQIEMFSQIGQNIADAIMPREPRFPSLVVD